MIVHGIQKDMLDDSIAYILLTLNSQSSGCLCLCTLFSSVVYQPKKIGTKEMMAGDTQQASSINATTLFVMLMGYLSGFTIA